MALTKQGVQRLVAGLLLSGAVLGAQAQSTGSVTVEDHGFNDGHSSSTAASSGGAGGGGGSGVMVLMQQMNQYQQQIQNLQNQVEQLRHQLDTLKSAERDRYLDLDTRINALVDQVQGTAKTDTQSGDNGGQTQPPANPEADKQAYVAARSKLLDRDFPAAATAFENYLKNFPDGQFRGQSHFWLGEIYRNQKNPDLQKSREQFQIVVDKFPNHSKVPASLYELATLDAQAGDNAKAKVELNKLLQQFPDSSEAKLAKSMLDQLNGK